MGVVRDDALIFDRRLNLVMLADDCCCRGVGVVGRCKRVGLAALEGDMDKQNKPAILAYNFPQYHVDARNEGWHGKGWTEWDLVMTNPARFEGHVPLKPAWTPWDEADPEALAREIDLAADHGIDGFIYDVFWYEDGPFLQRAITDGYLKAPNRERMKFCCMWANHTWKDIFPVKSTIKPWLDERYLLDGKVSRAAFEKHCNLMIEWFGLPEYFRLQGRPYVSFYEPRNLVEAFGGEDGAARALEWFRDTARRRLGVELHIGVVGERLGVKGAEAAARVRRLGFDSATAYNAFDHMEWKALGFPWGSFKQMHETCRAFWGARDKRWDVPYIPNLTVGWDSTARCCPTDKWQWRGYPWLPVVAATRAEWAAAVGDLGRFFAETPGALPMATINAWNEWTEGCALLPSNRDGNMLLEVLKEARAGW